MGFEPTEHCCSRVFETRAFGRAMLPLQTKVHYSIEPPTRQILQRLSQTKTAGGARQRRAHIAVRAFWTSFSGGYTGLRGFSPPPAGAKDQNGEGGCVP